jgi:AraC-like DNA-binding protein
MPDPSVLPIRRYSAREVAEGTFHVDGLTCFLHSANHSGTSEVEVRLPRHLFVVVLDGECDEIAEDAWDGRPGAPRRVYGADNSLLVPEGQYFTSKTSGRTAHRYVACEIEQPAFARIFGDRLGEVELRRYCGPTLLAPGIAQRLESICRAPNSFPRAYAESVAAILLLELFRAHAEKPRLPEPAPVGPARFKLVVDFIEENLACDLGLFELADVTGLGVPHFAGAFKAAFGMTPERYIMERRIERAKTLMRTTGDSLATIAACVGFSNETQFSLSFARVTGSPPSAYRS